MCKDEDCRGTGWRRRRWARKQLVGCAWKVWGAAGYGRWFSPAIPWFTVQCCFRLVFSVVWVDASLRKNTTVGLDFALSHGICNVLEGEGPCLCVASTIRRLEAWYLVSTSDFSHVFSSFSSTSLMKPLLSPGELLLLYNTLKDSWNDQGPDCIVLTLHRVFT